MSLQCQRHLTPKNVTTITLHWVKGPISRASKMALWLRTPVSKPLNLEPDLPRVEEQNCHMSSDLHCVPGQVCPHSLSVIPPLSNRTFLKNFFKESNFLKHPSPNWKSTFAISYTDLELKPRFLLFSNHSTTKGSQSRSKLRQQAL